MDSLNQSQNLRTVGRGVTYSVRSLDRLDIAHRTTIELAGKWAARCPGSVVSRDDGQPLTPTEMRRIAEELPDYD